VGCTPESVNDLVLIVGPGVIIAIGGVALAWLKWRRPTPAAGDKHDEPA
jgi:hypothetical protein